MAKKSEMKEIVLASGTLALLPICRRKQKDKTFLGLSDMTSCVLLLCTFLRNHDTNQE